MLGGLVILCLVGCAEEPVIPVGIQDHPGVTVSQLLQIYALLSGKTAMGPNDMLKSEEYIYIHQDCPLTYSEARKLIEDNLRGQAGIVIVRQDR